MATVTFTFGAKSKSFTITAGSATRLTNYATAAYPLSPDPVISMIDAIWAGVRANVVNSELTTGVQAVAIPADLT